MKRYVGPGVLVAVGVGLKLAGFPAGLYMSAAIAGVFALFLTWLAEASS